MYEMSVEEVKRYKVLQEVKEEIKTEASEIRRLKESRTRRHRDKDIPLWKVESDIASHRNNVRHKHIAYCEFRGKERSQIEMPRIDNKPYERLIKKYKDKWTEEIYGDRPKDLTILLVKQAQLRHMRRTVEQFDSA